MKLPAQSLRAPADARDAMMAPSMTEAWAVRPVYGPHWGWLFALYFALAVICGYQSWSRIVIERDGTIWTNQSSIDSVVAGLSDAPIGTGQFAVMRSRVLVPLMIVEGNRYFGIPYRVTHDGTRLLFIFLSLVLLHWHFRAWFTPLESFAGTVVVVASITTTFNTFYPIVTDFPELAGMTLCAGLLVRRRWAWMLVALAVATLNRETSIILLPAAVCLLYRRRERGSTVLLVAVSIALTWWLSFGLARHLSGVSGDWIQAPGGTLRGQGLAAELVGIFVDTWPRRAEALRSLLYNPHPYNVNWSILLVLHTFWILPLFYWRSVPATLRRLYIGGLLGGLPIFLLVGVLNEAGRHMIPLYPLVLPAGLHVFSRFIVAPARPLLAEALNDAVDRERLPR